MSLGLFALAFVGALAGIYLLWLHLTTDPLADVHAYYDAGARLNAGQPLYLAGANPDLAEFYRYPPVATVQGFEWMGASAWQAQLDASAALQSRASNTVTSLEDWSLTYPGSTDEPRLSDAETTNQVPI